MEIEEAYPWNEGTDYVTPHEEQKENPLFSKGFIMLRGAATGRNEELIKKHSTVSKVFLMYNRGTDEVILEANGIRVERDADDVRASGLGKAKFEMMKELSEKVNERYCVYCKQYTRILRIDSSRKKRVIPVNIEEVREQLKHNGSCVTVRNASYWNDAIMYVPFVGHVRVEELGRHTPTTTSKYLLESGFTDKKTWDLWLKKFHVRWFKSNVYRLHLLDDGYYMVTRGKASFKDGLCFDCYRNQYPIRNSTVIDEPDTAPKTAEIPTHYEGSEIDKALNVCHVESDRRPTSSLTSHERTGTLTRELHHEHYSEPWINDDLNFISAVDLRASKSWLGNGKCDWIRGEAEDEYNYGGN